MQKYPEEKKKTKKSIIFAIEPKKFRHIVHLSKSTHMICKHLLQYCQSRQNVKIWDFEIKIVLYHFFEKNVNLGKIFGNSFTKKTKLPNEKIETIQKNKNRYNSDR